MIYKNCTKCGRKLNYRNKLKGRNGCKMCARKYAKEKVQAEIDANMKQFILDRPDVKKIEGYDRYFAAPNGDIFSVNAAGVKNMSKSIDKYGYPYVTLYNDKSKRIWKIHQLIALTFIPNKYPYIKKFINHKDGIKNNNNVENLEWCTPKQNSQHALKTGLTPKGSQKLNSKLTEQKVLEIFQSRNKKTHKQLAEEYGVSVRLISLIMTGKVWRHVKRIAPKRRLLCSRKKKGDDNESQ